jgi:hypothetical protein
MRSGEAGTDRIATGSGQVTSSAAPVSWRSSKKQRTTNTLTLPFAAAEAAIRKELPCPTRL